MCHTKPPFSGLATTCSPSCPKGPVCWPHSVLWHFRPLCHTGILCPRSVITSQCHRHDCPSASWPLTHNSRSVLNWPYSRQLPSGIAEACTNWPRPTQLKSLYLWSHSETQPGLTLGSYAKPHPSPGSLLPQRLQSPSFPSQVHLTVLLLPVRCPLKILTLRVVQFL